MIARITTIILLINNLLGNSNDYIKIFTEEYPPHNMIINGKLVGSSVEVLDAVFKQMKSTQSLKDVKLTNWARGYSITQARKNTMIFSTIRTKERDKLFKWVGPINSSSIVMIALKSKHIKINKMSDFNKYIIGVAPKDIGESILLEHNISKDNFEYIKGSGSIDAYLKAIKKNGIDMFPYAKNVFSSKIKGFDINKYEAIYNLMIEDEYFAFNKDTDDSIIDKWQKALDEVKANGSYQKIIEKY